MKHDFLKALQKDHDEQRELTQKFKQAKHPAQWEKLFQEIREELKPHVEGEEASIFAQLKDSADREVRLDALEKIQEHHVAKLLLKEAAKLESDSEEFWAKIKVLQELNEHHIDEEEEETFTILANKFSSTELDKMYEQYRETKEKIKENLT